MQLRWCYKSPIRHEANFWKHIMGSSEGPFDKMGLVKRYEKALQDAKTCLPPSEEEYMDLAYALDTLAGPYFPCREVSH